MAATKSDSFNHVNFQLPDVEKATLFNIIKDLVFSTNVKHRWIITISIFIQILLKRYLAYPLKIFGSLIEDLLNGNIFLRKKEGWVEENGHGFISFIGQIDSRMELNKDIKHGDARYYPALSMMASKLVYENEHVIQTIVSRLWKMEHVKFYDCYNDYQKKRTTEAFIMREETEEDDKIIVAFRGTSPFDADDWSTDFDYSWCNIHGMGKTHMGFMVALGLKRYNNYDDNEDINCDFPKQIEQDPERPLAYYVIRDKLKEIMENNNNYKNKRVKFIMTGHSLGGALAILFPALLALHGEVDLLNNLEAVYAFGQPRVGNEQFGQFMKIILREHKIKYYRIVYAYDIVPTVPLDNTFMTFKHFGTSIHFNALYRGKIVEEEQQKEVKKGVKKYLKNLRGIVMITTECILARLTALLEFIRGFIIGFIAGPYYREGWLLICFRSFGILFPGVVNHNPQDYVNATMLASPDLFEIYPATNT